MARRGSRSNAPEPGSDDELRSRLELLESKLYAAKTAYLNGTVLDGKEMTYDDLVAIATEYMQTSYTLQKRRFGSIKVRLSIPKLLR